MIMLAKYVFYGISNHLRAIESNSFELNSFQRTKNNWVTSCKSLFLPNANNKGADQPAHPRSLISAFIVRCLDSIIPLLAIAEISKP